MRCVGIDQSYTSCGICILEDDKLIFGKKLSSIQTEDIYLRAVSIADQIANIVEFHKVDHIAIEGLAFGMRGSATRDLAGLLFTIIIILRQRGLLSPDIITPLSLKKFATGSGKAKKEEMIRSLPVDARTYFDSQNYKKTTGLADMADAFWLAKFIQHKYTDNT